MKNELSTEIKSGLTWRSLIASIYAAIVILPASIWLGLTVPYVTLQSVGWMTFILFEEIFRRSGKPLLKQEATITLSVATVVSEGGIAGLFTGFIYHVYYKMSPYAAQFGITNQIPWWYAPKFQVGVWNTRTFFDSAMFPIIFLGIGFSILRLVANISMGLFVRRLYIEGEKLQFPIEEMTASGIETIVSREKTKFRLLTLVTIIGIIYSVILYVPFATTGGETTILPLPWFDFNDGLHRLLPGASFGLATSIIFFAAGLILPFYVVICTFLGSVATWFIGNWLIIEFNWTTFSQEFVYGMDITTIYQRSWLHVWALPFIGVTLAAAIMPTLRHPGYFIGALKDLTKRRAQEYEREHVLPMSVLFILWLCATSVSIIIVYWLVPGYPIWIMFIISIAWALIFNLASTRSLGEAGIGLSNPDMFTLTKYGYIATSNYKNLDIWFINPIIASGGPTFCTRFKVCDLTDTSVKSYLKTYLIMYPIMILISMFFVASFWQIAPMPSSSYPATAISWPVRAINQSLWYSGRMFQQLDPLTALYSFLGVGGVYVFTQILRIPFSLAGLVSGMVTPIPILTTQLLGGVFAKILEKKFGKEQWNNSKRVIAAGLTLGDSMVIAVSTAFLVVTKSLWLIPY